MRQHIVQGQSRILRESPPVPIPAGISYRKVRVQGGISRGRSPVPRKVRIVLKVLLVNRRIGTQQVPVPRLFQRLNDEVDEFGARHIYPHNTLFVVQIYPRKKLKIPEDLKKGLEDTLTSFPNQSIVYDQNVCQVFDRGSVHPSPPD